MNIKGLPPTFISPIDRQSRIDGETRMRDSNGDRDADGRRAPQAPPAKDRLKQDEFDEAIEILKNLPGLIASNLSVQVEVLTDQRITLIVDPAGKTVRRLTEGQLWAATRDKDRPTGSILDKAM